MKRTETAISQISYQAFFEPDYASQSHKQVPFLTKKAHIGCINVRDMISVTTSIFTQAREFDGASRKSSIFDSLFLGRY